jgi:hypothetical protein
MHAETQRSQRKGDKIRVGRVIRITGFGTVRFCFVPLRTVPEVEVGPKWAPTASWMTYLGKWIVGYGVSFGNGDNMTSRRHLLVVRAHLFSLVAFGIFSLATGNGQAQAESPSELVAHLAWHPAATLELVVFTCETQESKDAAATAKALAGLGESAVPAIESSLQDLERQGEQSLFAHNAGLLLFAYAKIKGPKAYPRLRSMLNNPALAFVEYAVDAAVAVSQGSTSYISFYPWTEVLSSAPLVLCGRVEPRVSLDYFILAWEANNRSSLEEILSRKAKDSLDQFLGGRTWAQMRADLSADRLKGVGVGYRFLNAPAKWSEPIMNLMDAEIPDVYPSRIDVDLQTSFASGSGIPCGTHLIPLFEVATIPSKYLINDSDIGSLLRIISSCAVLEK